MIFAEQSIELMKLSRVSSSDDLLIARWTTLFLFTECPRHTLHVGAEFAILFGLVTAQLWQASTKDWR